MVTQINTTLADILKATAGGDPRTAIGNTLFGFDHRRTRPGMPVNYDDHGLTFMTRPQLNLTDSNVLAISKLVPLLTTESLSIQRMVRKTLDPRITLPCPVYDDKQAFITITTNLLESLTGWPDPSVQSYISKKGNRGEEFGFIDGYIDDFSAYPLTATFRSIPSNPIKVLIDSWVTYGASVFAGTMMPYPDMIAHNEIDYTTRIYRLILDRSRRWVREIACCGAAYPFSSTTAQTFNYNAKEGRSTAYDEVSVNFQCFGYMYNDFEAVDAFNKTVGTFNPDMQDGNYESSMQKIDPSLYTIFRNRGYPRINTQTMELEWWVQPGLYQSVMEANNRSTTALGYPVNAADQEVD